MAKKFEKLTIKKIIKILKTTPEQNVFDWKRDLRFNKSKDKKGEIIKDIVAIANSITDEPGYIFYGVDTQCPNPLLNIPDSYDDANFQQLVNSRVEPEISFLLYPVVHENGKIYVIHISPSYNKPHIIIKDYGKLREGQIPIRMGSSTRGIRSQDLIDIYYDLRNPLFKEKLNLVNSYVKIIQSNTQLFEQLKAEEDDINEEAKKRLGLQ